MSLYNMVHGENKDAEKLLSFLGLTKNDFGRFRDAYLNGDGTEIIIYTRCGGGNRESYDDVFETMENHDNYISDYDDEVDGTYCYFRFDVPEKFLQVAKEMSTGKEPKSVHEKFEEAIEKMKNPNSEEAKIAEKIAQKIQKGIDDNPNGGVIIMSDGD